MKTVSKFSGTLLLITSALLSSYVLMQKGSTESTKAITTPGSNKTATLTQAFEHVTKMDSAIHIRKASCACGQLKVTTKGPDPERRSLCTCHLCQKQSGSVFSVQARFPKEEVTIEGKSKAWRFPGKDGKTVTGRTCADGGGTFYFCPVCGTTVYYTADADIARIGVKVGCFADPTFPPPMIAGFEEYMYPWAFNVSALPMPGGHHQ